MKVVILSEAKDLLFAGAGMKQVLRCAKDDKIVNNSKLNRKLAGGRCLVVRRLAPAQPLIGLLLGR
jgi:hypothetical protein